MKTIQKIAVRISNYLLSFVEYFLYWPEPKVITKYDEIVDILKKHQVSKVFLVSDPNISKFGLTKSCKEALKAAKIDFVEYTNVASNPTFENVYKGKELYLNNNCDGLIAIGGGSVMDCCKTIGVLIKNKGNIEKFKGLFKVRHRMPLMIASPTTAGTGSETTIAAVIRNEKTGAKFPIESMKLVPKYAFLDKEMLLNLPPLIFATTGMDALTHAIEAYLNIDSTSKTRKYSLEACKLIKDNLVQGFNDKNDLTAKGEMLKASFLAGKAFTRSMVGNVHAIAHALGGKYNLPHGYLNAIILPRILDIYKNRNKGLKKMSKIAIHIGIGKPSNSVMTNTNLLIKWIDELNAKFGLPSFIKEIKREDLYNLAHASYKEAVPLYPCPVLFDEQDFKEIYVSLMEK
jgi:alcohol dehydrogenase